MEYKLEYLVDDEPKIFYLARDEVVIGKLSENDIELKDNSVSRQHCKLQRVGKGYKLIDMKSTNGCYVNGQRVQNRLLEVGDKITVGRTILSFLTVSKEENYRDSSDQKISLIVPLDELIKADIKPKLKNAESNFLASLTELGRSLIASRLESSLAGTDEIVVAETTYLATSQKFDFELLGEKKLHGISQPVKAYRVKGLKGAT